MENEIKINVKNDKNKIIKLGAGCFIDGNHLCIVDAKTFKNLQESEVVFIPLTSEEKLLIELWWAKEYRGN